MCIKEINVWWVDILSRIIVMCILCGVDLLYAHILNSVYIHDISCTELQSIFKCEKQ